MILEENKKTKSAKVAENEKNMIMFALQRGDNDAVRLKCFFHLKYAIYK